MVLIHGRFQFLKSGFLWLEKAEMLDKLQTFYHDPFRQSRRKHKDHHKDNTENIQTHAQVKYPHVLAKISLQKSSAQKPDCNSDHHQNCFIGNGDDHQNQCSDRNRKFVFFHKINLHGLSAGCRRGDAAEKKSHKRIQGAMSYLYFCTKSPHHIEDDHGLPKYEQHHAGHTDQ